MLAKRIIPCLDVKDGRVVKGIHFVQLRDAGDPVELADAYNQAGADELVFLDITASSDRRDILIDVVERTARKVFIPLCVGGGVRSVADARRILLAGADKVSVNTAAVERPDLITELSEEFGAQAVVLAIDAHRRPAPEAQASVPSDLPIANTGGEKRIPSRDREGAVVTSHASLGWNVFTYGGRRDTGLDAIEWARRGESLGAGEILLTSMDRDGTQVGFDCELTRSVSQATNIPVIASGGGGRPEDFVEVLQQGRADAALAASIFHYGTYSVGGLKEILRAQGIPVRIPR